MLLPIGTDAPIYYRPWATIGLIAANAVSFVLTCGGSQPDAWILEPGALNPIEWISSAFLHFGLAHLLGNMLFLWVFGLIVEGKLGWWKFLALYLALCCFDGCVAQIALMTSDVETPGAGGASGVIYALMAIALVWAPKNCIDMIFVWSFRFVFRVHRFDVSVRMLAAYFIGTDLLLAWFVGFAPSTSLLHILGAAVGFPVGVAMLWMGMVDCEGWDLFSILRNDPRTRGTSELHARHGSAHLTAVNNRVKRRTARDTAAELRKIAWLIKQHQPTPACSRYLELCENSPEARLSESLHQRLIDDLRKHHQWKDVLLLLDKYIEHFPKRASRARLMKAGLLIKELERPIAALRALEGVSVHALSPQKRRYYQSIRRLAEQQLADGVIEMQQV